VTGYAATTGDRAVHALLYGGGTVADLGTFGGTFSDGVAINASGQVVGDAATKPLSDSDDALTAPSPSRWPSRSRP
jgi:hypothetical protein